MTNSEPEHWKKKAYKRELGSLWCELAKLHAHVAHRGIPLLVIVEGRDAAGKDGLIKTIVRNLSPRESRVVALGAPSDHDRKAWYFQRFVPNLPVAGELCIFNRSWYNRAGVELVMGFCTKKETERFLASVVPFEALLAQSGLQLVKYYLDIPKDEQKKRLDERAADPLRSWKQSPVDARAQELWKEYSHARDRMLEHTDHAHAPWTVVRAGDKRTARIHTIRHLLSRIEYPGRPEERLRTSPDVILPAAEARLHKGWLAP